LVCHGNGKNKTLTINIFQIACNASWKWKKYNINNRYSLPTKYMLCFVALTAYHNDFKKKQFGRLDLASMCTTFQISSLAILNSLHTIKHTQKKLINIVECILFYINMQHIQCTSSPFHVCTPFVYSFLG